jgi:hypothetical protein
VRVVDIAWPYSAKERFYSVIAEQGARRNAHREIYPDLAQFSAARAYDRVYYPYSAAVAQSREKKHHFIHGFGFDTRLYPVEKRRIHFFQALQAVFHLSVILKMP